MNKQGIAGNTFPSYNFANRSNESGFAQRVKEARSIDSTIAKARALEALAKDIKTCKDLCTLIQAGDALLATFQRDVDKALVSAWAAIPLDATQQQPPPDLSESDLQALEEFCVRVRPTDSSDQQAWAWLHQLLERWVRRRIEALMNLHYGADHSIIERELEEHAPLCSGVPSLKRFIDDIQDILGYQHSANTSAVSVRAAPVGSVELPKEIGHLIALRLLRGVTLAKTRDDFNASISDLLNFGLVCKLFHNAAQTAAIPQALALHLPFAGLPQWLKAFQAAIDAARSTSTAALNSTSEALLNTAQQSVVQGYLKYAGSYRTNTQLAEAIKNRKTIEPFTGITHSLGSALIAYAHRVHRFPIQRPMNQANKMADDHLTIWDELKRRVLVNTRTPTVGAAIEVLIALAADEQLNMRPWATSPATNSDLLSLLINFSWAKEAFMEKTKNFDLSVLTSGTNAIATILLAAHDPDGSLAIEQAQINETLDFLVHYTALGYAIPASAQEALAQVIVHVGMDSNQAAKLGKCLEQSHNAQREWT